MAYATDYTGDNALQQQPCPTIQIWDGSSSTGTFEDFMRENEAKFRSQPLPPVDDEFPDDYDYNYKPVYNEPNDVVIDFKDPAFIFGVMLVISILLNCCQTYKSFGGFKSGLRRKKVYQGIAQTDNSDVEMM